MIKIIIIIIIVYILFESLYDYKKINKNSSLRKINNNISNIWLKIDNDINSEYPNIYFIKYNISNKILNEWKKVVPNIIYDESKNELIIPSKDESSALGLIYLISLTNNDEVSLDYILANNIIENTINDINNNNNIKIKIINYVISNNKINEKGILINKNLYNKEILAENPKQISMDPELVKHETLAIPSYNISSQHQDNESLSQRSQCSQCSKNSSSVYSSKTEKTEKSEKPEKFENYQQSNSQKLRKNNCKTELEDSTLISQIIPQQGRLNKNIIQTNFDDNKVQASNTLNNDDDDMMSDINGYDMTNSEYTFL